MMKSTLDGGDEDTANTSIRSTNLGNNHKQLGVTLQELFFGKITSILKLKNDTKQKEVSRTSQKMGPILLDVNLHSDLYEAWDSYQFEEIEGYNDRENSQSIYVSAMNVKKG
jgi:hypothetical protein